MQRFALHPQLVSGRCQVSLKAFTKPSLYPEQLSVLERPQRHKRKQLGSGSARSSTLVPQSSVSRPWAKAQYCRSVLGQMVSPAELMWSRCCHKTSECGPIAKETHMGISLELAQTYGKQCSMAGQWGVAPRNTLLSTAWFSVFPFLRSPSFHTQCSLQEKFGQFHTELNRGWSSKHQMPGWTYFAKHQ